MALNSKCTRALTFQNACLASGIQAVLSKDWVTLTAGIHTHMHTYIHMYIYTYVCIHAYIHTYVCVCVCVCVCMCVLTAGTDSQKARAKVLYRVNIRKYSEALTFENVCRALQAQILKSPLGSVFS